jgi:uncharacterized protein YdaU (DUF1376 family)
MKPDAYMQFYGNDFFRAVAGLPDFIRIGYLTAIWYYWHQNHTRGLKHDDLFLRKICEIDESQWSEFRDAIFDNDKFFVLDGDALWQQGRAQKEWAIAMDKYQKKVNQTAGAREAKRLKMMQIEQTIVTTSRNRPLLQRKKP